MATAEALGLGGWVGSVEGIRASAACERGGVVASSSAGV